MAGCALCLRHALSCPPARPLWAGPPLPFPFLAPFTPVGGAIQGGEWGQRRGARSRGCTLVGCVLPGLVLPRQSVAMRQEAFIHRAFRSATASCRKCRGRKKEALLPGPPGRPDPRLSSPMPGKAGCSIPQRSDVCRHRHRKIKEHGERWMWALWKKTHSPGNGN